MAQETLLPDGTTASTWVEFPPTFAGAHENVDESVDAHDGFGTYIAEASSDQCQLTFANPTIALPLTSVKVRVIARNYGGNGKIFVDLRHDGGLVGTMTVTPTGSWALYEHTFVVSLAASDANSLRVILEPNNTGGFAQAVTAIELFVDNAPAFSASQLPHTVMPAPRGLFTPKLY